MILELIGGQLVTWLVSAAGVLAVLAGVWFKGRSSGKKSERERQQKERAKVDAKIDKVEDAVDRMTPEEKRKELGEWSPGSS